MLSSEFVCVLKKVVVLFTNLEIHNACIYLATCRIRASDADIS